MQFQLESPFQPAGDQPAAIKSLVEGLKNGQREQVLMGVTGSGKTFTMANVIQQLQRPALILSHNKTLAAQLYSEFKEFFPHNAVSYFVSYYDYYQPEAYIPQRDIYIEKDASINEEIDRMRLATTSSLVSRRDVIVVASVSCIYGLGSPEDYKQMMVGLQVGQSLDRDDVLARLVDIQYDRNDADPARGKFRVRGDCVEIWPSYEEFAYRIEFWGDEIERLSIINPVTGEAVNNLEQMYIYPAKHFVLPEERIHNAVDSIRKELAQQLDHFRSVGKMLEAQRLNARTRFDIEMMMEVGYCPGIENYSRPLSGKPPGSSPSTLFDFFPKDYLLFIDESHATVPQIGAMYAGDRSRKETLVEHGFRLPSALDNRPLKFDEWRERVSSAIYVSATPGKYELGQTGGEVIEQVVRPTGLLDPVIEVVPARGQVPHLLEEIRARVAVGERTLVTTLTKRLAEDLSNYFLEQGIACKWLHSELDAFERVELLRDLRQGRFEALVGVNLLREGLDLPEVSLVAILDADKEGFLRSETSLMQTIGRAARNVNAKVILYGDKMTNSMQRAIDETERRRKLQHEYNQAHGITPETIKKAIHRGIEADASAHARANAAVGRTDEAQYITAEYLAELEAEMLAAADALEFERAAAIRDRIEKMQDSIGETVDSVKETKAGKGRRGKGRVPRPKRNV
ncbi:MAG: excinuclease ABC subunit UvrB [Planctomycetaceae bacterium]|uniref:UvrABC system protein B n=1 Tax=Lacipirellula limnantheis TaxID=2528024 RepID=A0A517U2C4_9BACT|nr:excinuclease ABC subunit UvrB [Lacipirellula limnantheis]MBL9165458.1 excinuclease ABC subunit UvrB [Planctomycetaceae bacterium]QDT74774.1 UvrABC system protein B [Lacipirellula limnantheis]